MLSLPRALACASFLIAAAALPSDAAAAPARRQRQRPACTRPGQLLTTCDCKSEFYMKDADQKRCVCNSRQGLVARGGRCVHREPQRACTRPAQLLSTCDCKSEFMMKDGNKCVCNTRAGYTRRGNRCVQASSQQGGRRRN